MRSSMCNRYVAPNELEMERLFHIGRANPVPWLRTIFARSPGAFIRRACEDAGYSRELVVGQWGLIPWSAKEPRLKYSTNNDRLEELEAKATLKDPWPLGGRCFTPALSFDEPNWETGKNHGVGPSGAQTVRRGALPAMWNTWLDQGTGEVHESYTMLTINADVRPLMRRMRKAHSELPLDQQDKCRVISLEMVDRDRWLAGPLVETRALLPLAPVDIFDTRPTEETA